MKKLICIFSIVLLSLMTNAQNSFDKKFVFWDKADRSLIVDSTEYIVLSIEKLHKNYYRIMLWNDFKYFDAIWDKNKFIHIEEIK